MAAGLACTETGARVAREPGARVARHLSDAASEDWAEFLAWRLWVRIVRYLQTTQRKRLAERPVGYSMSGSALRRNSILREGRELSPLDFRYDIWGPAGDPGVALPVIRLRRTTSSKEESHAGFDLAIGWPSVKPSMTGARAVRDPNRRGFLATSAAATAVPLLPDLDFLAPVSRAAATDTRIDPEQVRKSPSIGLLIKLIQTTPRDKCVPVFIEQLQAGLSYQDLLSALLLATIEHGDPHQVLGVYRRTASAAKRASKNGYSPCSGPWTAS